MSLIKVINLIMIRINNGLSTEIIASEISLSVLDRPAAFWQYRLDMVPPGFSLWFVPEDGLLAWPLDLLVSIHW